MVLLSDPLSRCRARATLLRSRDPTLLFMAFAVGPGASPLAPR